MAQHLFEAVDIMVPNVGTLHEEMALMAMRHERHVFLEKPISAGELRRHARWAIYKG